MGIVTQVALTMQNMLGLVAEQVARGCRLIRRQRKFSGATLVQTMVLGFLRKPNASLDDLAATAAQLGVNVTPQAIEKRFTAALVDCLRQVWEVVVQQVVAAQPLAIPLLQKFTHVRIGDSTTIALPDEFAAEFPGCGGKSDSGLAALKIQVQWDLSNGALTKLELEAGRDSDARSVLQRDLPPAGSLSIYDLGYFALAKFWTWIAAGAYWISRLQPGTAVYDAQGRPLNLLDELPRMAGAEPVDMPVLLGKSERVPCRLIAVRAPQHVVGRRRRKAYEKAQKHGRVPTAEHLAWCAWTVFITNCPLDMLTWKEVVVLYRSRWQIELLFKLWKSHNLLAKPKRVSAHRQLAELFARMTAVILQHWLLLSTVWEDVRHSFVKAAKVIRDNLVLLTTHWNDLEKLAAAIQTLAQLLARHTQINRRRKSPGTFQLLQNPELLAYGA